jgi:hypothetical protein
MVHLRIWEIAQGRLEIFQKVFRDLVENFSALGEVHKNEIHVWTLGTFFRPLQFGGIQEGIWFRQVFMIQAAQAKSSPR